MSTLDSYNFTMPKYKNINNCLNIDFFINFLFIKIKKKK
jgi:hypothetical protein